VPRLVSADERDPLIQVDRPEHRMRVHDIGEGQTVARAHRIAQRVACTLERRPCRVGVQLARRQRRLRRRDPAGAIEDASHVDRADDG